MNTRTLGTITLLMGAFALVLAACPTPDPGEDDEIVWAIGGPGAEPGGTFQEVVEMWNEGDRDFEVRIETLPEDADEQRVQQTLVLDAGGADFDVLAMDVIWTGEYAENGWIVSWEDRRAELEDVVLAGPMESAEFQGELWAVPFSSNASFLYYRTDLVDEPPTTRDELRQVGMEVAEEEGIAAFLGQGPATRGSW